MISGGKARISAATINGKPYEGGDKMMDYLRERALHDPVAQKEENRTRGDVGEETTYKIRATMGGVISRLKALKKK